MVAFAALLILLLPVAAAQDIPPELLDEASRATGLSKEELQRRYAQQMAAQPAPATATQAPGRQSLDGVVTPPAGRGEASYWPEKPVVQSAGGAGRRRRALGGERGIGTRRSGGPRGR